LGTGFANFLSANSRIIIYTCVNAVSAAAATIFTN
jgi:hypothetical protein